MDVSPMFKTIRIGAKRTRIYARSSGGAAGAGAGAGAGGRGGGVAAACSTTGRKLILPQLSPKRLLLSRVCKTKDL